MRNNRGPHLHPSSYEFERRDFLGERTIEAGERVRHAPPGNIPVSSYVRTERIALQFFPFLSDLSQVSGFYGGRVTPPHGHNIINSLSRSKQVFIYEELLNIMPSVLAILLLCISSERSCKRATCVSDTRHRGTSRYRPTYGRKESLCNSFPFSPT